ncbi:serine hydrolase domain-containing protein [Amycolatopsis nigrescens]|uniref:serine hydrolase domain-containing protein n=1 Tax=Amycolatopsis nigrescens TaxID=381445 RepID=UPI001B7F8609|nr:serine hydrolase domain-containing protein [Amycolatopsis nigrescens]
MPRAFRRAGVAAVAVTLLAGPGLATAAAGQDRPELREAMQAFVDSGIAGVQLRVHDERGDWAGSAGVRRLGEAAKPSTNGRFRAGSVTKTFTATVVLQLVGEGKVGLDAPAADYLPEFGLDRRITVRMLLQHTSGVFNQTGDYDRDGTYVPGVPWSGKEWVDNRFRTYQPEELVRFALSKPLRFAPGTEWRYSNTNYVLARLLIEEVTGRSYVEETQRRILRPLGMRGTGMPGFSPEIPGPHAHAYYRYEDAGQQKTVDVTRQNPSWVSAGGDLISTTQDLGTFMSALMGGRLLPDPLLAEMRKPDPTMGYGLGLFVQDGTSPSPFPPPSCGVTVLNHNGGMQGSATLMYSTPDGSKTLTASLNYVDDAAQSGAGTFRTGLQRLVDEVFCEGH